MINRQTKTVISAFIFLFFIFSLSILQAENLVRIGIVRNVPNVTISGEGVFEVTDYKTNQNFMFNHPVDIRVKNTTLLADGRQITKTVAKVQAIDGMIKVNNKPFRGVLEIRSNIPNTLTVINILDVEEYLYGVIKQEISPQWPQEAVKAQIVAARAYTFKNMGKHAKEGFDLCASTCCQVYGGYNSEDPVSNRLIEQTRAEVLVYNKELASTPYHGFCGGYTEDPRNVWETVKKIPYLKVKKCTYCRNAPRMKWTTELPGEKIAKILNNNGSKVGKITQIKPAKKSRSGRIVELKIKHTQRQLIIKANKFRLLMGSDLIRSANFSITKKGDTYIFNGIGWGHGVGLCQEGAKGMAEKGYDYKEILQFYYPGTKISKWSR